MYKFGERFRTAHAQTILLFRDLSFRYSDFAGSFDDVDADDRRARHLWHRIVPFIFYVGVSNSDILQHNRAALLLRTPVYMAFQVGLALYNCLVSAYSRCLRNRGQPQPRKLVFFFFLRRVRRKFAVRDVFSILQESRAFMAEMGWHHIDLREYGPDNTIDLVYGFY